MDAISSAHRVLCVLLLRGRLGKGPCCGGRATQPGWGQGTIGFWACEAARPACHCLPFVQANRRPASALPDTKASHLCTCHIHVDVQAHAPCIVKARSHCAGNLKLGVRACRCSCKMRSLPGGTGRAGHTMKTGCKNSLGNHAMVSSSSSRASTWKVRTVLFCTHAAPSSDITCGRIKRLPICSADPLPQQFSAPIDRQWTCAS